MWSKFLQIFQDASGEMSSKRVFGGLGFLASLVMCFTGVGVEVIAVVIGTSAAMLGIGYRDWETDRKSTRLNSSHSAKSRMPSSA